MSIVLLDLTAQSIEKVTVKKDDILKVKALVHYNSTPGFTMNTRMGLYTGIGVLGNYGLKCWVDKELTVGACSTPGTVEIIYELIIPAVDSTYSKGFYDATYGIAIYMPEGNRTAIVNLDNVVEMTGNGRSGAGTFGDILPMIIAMMVIGMMNSMMNNPTGFVGGVGKTVGGIAGGVTGGIAGKNPKAIIKGAQVGTGIGENIGHTAGGFIDQKVNPKRYKLPKGIEPQKFNDDEYYEMEPGVEYIPPQSQNPRNLPVVYQPNVPTVQGNNPTPRRTVTTTEHYY